MKDKGKKECERRLLRLQPCPGTKASQAIAAALLPEESWRSSTMYTLTTRHASISGRKRILILDQNLCHQQALYETIGADDDTSMWLICGSVDRQLTAGTLVGWLARERRGIAVVVPGLCRELK
jgi:hypothetical protein